MEQVFHFLREPLLSKLVEFLLEEHIGFVELPHQFLVLLLSQLQNAHQLHPNVHSFIQVLPQFLPAQEWEFLPFRPRKGLPLKKEFHDITK